MTSGSPEIIACPPDRLMEAMSLVLCDIAPSQRQEIAATLPASTDNVDMAGGGLFVAMRGDQLCGTAWGQRQPGNTAVFWPPQLVSGENVLTASLLAESVIAELDRTAVGMAQVLLSPDDTSAVRVIENVGFRLLADLLYLSWETAHAPAPSPTQRELQFIACGDSQIDRLSNLLEQTYEESRDCPALNGARQIEEVIEGYRATGVFRAENWLIIRGDSHDVGVLILADHPAARHWELVYMGLVPSARGRGWGQQVTGHAQLLALRANVERIVLAVDAANEPALRMYRSAGFHAWDRRTVFARFCATATDLSAGVVK